MSDKDTILKIMLTNKNKRIWTAKDFQKDPYFVGYEATARMSELLNQYPDLFEVGKEGKFRTLAINWNYEDIQEMVKCYAEM